MGARGRDFIAGGRGCEGGIGCDGALEGLSSIRRERGIHLGLVLLEEVRGLWAFPARALLEAAGRSAASGRGVGLGGGVGKHSGRHGKSNLIRLNSSDSRGEHSHRRHRAPRPHLQDDPPQCLVV